MVHWTIWNISGAAVFPKIIEPAAEDGASNCQHLLGTLQAPEYSRLFESLGERLRHRSGSRGPPVRFRGPGIKPDLRLPYDQKSGLGPRAGQSRDEARGPAASARKEAGGFRGRGGAGSAAGRVGQALAGLMGRLNPAGSETGDLSRRGWPFTRKGTPKPSPSHLLEGNLRDRGGETPVLLGQALRKNPR